MKVNNIELPPPDTISWQSPEVIIVGVKGEPVIGPLWRCSLGYEQTSDEVHQQWARLLGMQVTVELPTPFSQCPEPVQGWVESVEPRLTPHPAALGFDVVISGIVLSYEAGIP